jgi:predicted nucleotidyltransferase
MREKLSNSSGAIYLDRTGRIGALRSAVSRAKERIPEIQHAILFGSLSSGKATPRSDADILIVVRSSSHKLPRDSIPEMLRALSPLPCPVDLFILTSSEFERYRCEGSPLLRVVADTGIHLL